MLSPAELGRSLENLIWLGHRSKSELSHYDCLSLSLFLLTKKIAPAFDLLLPCSYDQLYSVQEACHQVALSIQTGPETLLEAYAGYL